MKRAAPPDVEVTTYVTGVPGKYVQSVADDTRTLVTQALGPYAAPAAVRASSITRLLDGTGSDRRRVGYLSGIGGLADRARLTTGRWPQPTGTTATGTTAAGPKTSGPLETVVLESTARLLNLKPGSRVRLAAQAGFGQEAPPVSLV